MLVTDACVVVKMFVPETDSAKAEALAESDMPLALPEHGLGEVLEILRRKVGAGELEASSYWEVVGALAPGFQKSPLTPLLNDAAEISLETGVSVYDALYLAQAASLGTRVLTSDVKMLRKLRGSRFERLAIDLASWDPPRASAFP
ncbi:type II toxin-antitoxin system VapC family toxin [Prosthecomicrobium sp. N25]|uniref:type II toxin-antitoxin system VapC family toxin n=1 Tax=Prosthecomicrobium sp. N25 TaxID=3129254 RepID=UPI003077443F